jgi:hypothetical protein
MKTLTRLCMVFVMVAITATAVYAGRPQCWSPEPPPGAAMKVCFDEYADDGYFTWLGFRTAPFDVAGPTLLYSWTADGFGLMLPGGNYVTHTADSEVDLYVCPLDYYWDCLDALLASDGYPAPLEGMWVGKTHITWLWTYDENFSGACPWVIQSNGMVSDPAGQMYKVMAKYLGTKKDTGDGCTTVLVDLKITPKDN